MSIHSDENIREIVKLSRREFPHLVQNRENICTQKLCRIQYPKFPEYYSRRINSLIVTALKYLTEHYSME